MNIRQLFWAAAKKMSRKGLYRFLTDELQNCPDGSLVLSVGAGGEISRIVKVVSDGRGFTTIFTDVDADRQPDVVDDISKSGFLDQHFDVVVIMEVLEHITEPAKAAFEIERILKRGGKLILSTPFIFPIHDRPYDFYRYTRYGLGYLFKNFENLQITERNSWAETIIVLIARLGFLGGLKGGIATLIFIPVCIILYPIALLGAKLLPSDYIATGYVLSGTRSKSA